MQQSLTEETHPVFTLELNRDEARFSNAGEIIDYLKSKIVQHPIASFIATFDHLDHTRALETGSLSEDFIAAQTIVFCFGITLQDPKALALRPRSIGVAETKNGFYITFLEPPMPGANVAMEDWVKSISKHS